IARPALSVGQARQAIDDGILLARANEAVTRDGSGARAVARLRERFASRTRGLSDGEALPVEAAELLRGDGGLATWADRMRQQAYGRLDKAAAQQNKNQVYADLSNGSAPMIR